MKSTGYILNGVYYDQLPDVESLRETHATTDKQYSHDRQRENHRRDLLQPYVNGHPNPEFIEQYPKEAKEYGFNKE
jgi:hypothetical protein